ncbi:MAG: hypothetical protein AB8H03_17900 [Saprospiraceae bacterium]
MKNQISHSILYILLQVLGIWVDGVLGIGFEMMAVLVFSMGKKRSVESLSRQGILIVVVEMLIDFFCGNAEMIFETGFWFLEEMRRVILRWSWVLSLMLISIFWFFRKEKILQNSPCRIDKIFFKLDEMIILILMITEIFVPLVIQYKKENPEFMINHKFGMNS